MVPGQWYMILEWDSLTTEQVQRIAEALKPLHLPIKGTPAPIKAQAPIEEPAPTIEAQAPPIEEPPITLSPNPPLKARAEVDERLTDNALVHQPQPGEEGS